MKYPFTPEILDAMPEYIAELYRGLEDVLLQEICSRLKAAGELNEVTVEDIRALRSHGISLADIKKAIAETTGISGERLESLLDDVVDRNKKYYGEFATVAEITMPKTMVSEKTIAAIRKQTKGEMKNITQSMGFAVRKGGKVVSLLPPAKAYQWAVDLAEREIASGAISYNQAIKHAVTQLADSGIKTVIYDNNGRKMYTQMDVAVRRAVMTGVSQVCDKYTEMAADKLETELYEVSAHAGARDTGYGWQNHADWQGKVYSIRDDDPEYPSIYEVCGLGEVDGLEGVNCRHRRFPFKRGVSERVYTDEELKNIDPKPFEFEGRTYTAYEATQRQREIERTVRKLERRESAYSAAGLKEDATATKARKKTLRAEYKRFSEAANLFTQPERMAVYY